ncbi:MAG: DUF4253 domain-containing protein [Pedobacter sp.]|nr:MAG: DUF4253 domain-containing protein [Pedobacter sp.]
MSIFSFFSRGKNKKEATPEKPVPAPEIAPDFKSVIAKLAKYSKKPLQRLPAIDPEDSFAIEGEFHEGYLALIPDQDTATAAALEFKAEIKGSAYRAFVFDGNEDGLLGVGLIKADSELDILRYRCTNAYNYDLGPEEVLAKIEDLDKRLGVTVVGCAMDWVELRFDKLPEDMDAFADEIYEFCPDSVDQGVGDIASLKEAITDMQGIFLCGSSRSA